MPKFKDGVRKQTNRRGASFSPAEVRLAAKVLSPWFGGGATLTDAELAVHAALRTKFERMAQSLDAETPKTLAEVLAADGAAEPAGV